MKQRLLIACVIGVLLMAVLPATQARAGAVLTLVEVNLITYQSEPAYEYVYDIISDIQYYNYRIEDLDTSGLLNLHGAAFYDKWGAEAAGYPTWAGWTTYPSLGDMASTWTLNPAHPDPSLNTWHLPSEYVGDYNPGYGACNAWGDGAVATVAVDGYDGLKFNYAMLLKTPQGLSQTLRLVHLDGPWGELTFAADDGHTNTVLGPGAAPTPGDFDDDGDVDADDIGDLCANLTGSGNPANDPKYDLDGDGDADQADMDILIHDLVETSAVSSPGTEYGDFDLDGDIDTTDLTILATNFGVGTTWALGNANCDLVIDTTDLTILATNFGFVASGGVPEPATLFVMGCGAIGLLRRPRSKIRRGGRSP